MKSITIHGMDDLLATKIEALAQKKQLSLNKVIKQLLRSAVGISETTKKSDFSDVIGVWSDSDFKEFSKTQETFSTIDPEDWK